MTRLRSIAALLFAAACPAAAQTTLHETEAKAAAVFSFLQYVDWPGARTGPLDLCVLGDPSSLLLTGQFQGQPVKGRALAARALDDKLSQLARCEAVFVDSADPRDLQRVAASIRQKPVLVIAEGAQALALGATIAVSVAGGKISFSVNLEQARTSGLSVSSKLLRLARTVIE